MLCAMGQTYKNYVSTSVTPGYLLAHIADLKHLAAHNVGIELSYEREVGYKDWGQFYANPTVGLCVLYYDLGRPEAGNAIGALFTTKLKAGEIGKSDLNFRMGAGLAFLSKRFDPYTNKRNPAIGSHLNGSMQFAFVMHTPLEKNYLEYGISISHYSNAAFKMPNLGYNMPSFTLRYGFGVNETQQENQLFEHTAATPWTLNSLLIFGKKERDFANPQAFYHYGLQIKAIRSVNEVKAWRFGWDGLLDKTYMFSEDPTVALDSIVFNDKLEMALSGGYQWSIGKVDVIAELGAYIYKPAVLKNPLLQRVGLVYNVNDNITVQGALRFHRGVADFFEMGVGYTVGL